MSPLIGNSIALRAMEPSDLELLYQWENDPEADQFIPSGLGSENSVIEL